MNQTSNHFPFRPVILQFLTSFNLIILFLIDFASSVSNAPTFLAKEPTALPIKYNSEDSNAIAPIHQEHQLLVHCK